MDADGDMTVSYEGFGPDVSQVADSGSHGTACYGTKSSIRRRTPTCWRPGPPWPASRFRSPRPTPAARTPATSNSGDPDTAIEQVLIQAQKYHGFTDAQLGRLDAIMNQVLSYLHGASQRDHVFAVRRRSDRPEHSECAGQRQCRCQSDGNNERLILAIDKDALIRELHRPPYQWGNRQVRGLQHHPGVYNRSESRGRSQATQEAILATLQAHTSELGINWPTVANGGYGWANGPVTVRLLSDQEISDRHGHLLGLDSHGSTGTDNQTSSQYVYEITFQGEVHETPISLRAQPNNAPWNILNVGGNGETADRLGEPGFCRTADSLS